MVEKVIWAHMLAYNVLRWHMLNAATLYETEPTQVSVTAAAAVMSANAGLIVTSTSSTRPALFASLYDQITRVPVGKRQGRSEPRAIKKRPKPRRYLMEPRNAWHATHSALASAIRGRIAPVLPLLQQRQASSIAGVRHPGSGQFRRENDRDDGRGERDDQPGCGLARKVTDPVLTMGTTSSSCGPTRPQGGPRDSCGSGPSWPCVRRSSPSRG